MEDDEKERLLRTYPPGRPGYSGHGGAVGVPSTVLEPPNQYKSRWRSIRVMYLTMFLSSVSFSICMSSLWPYLKLLDNAANTDFLGWVVASYSLGQLIASPLFGGWANCRGKSREPLVVSMLISVIANVLYSYLESIPSHKAVYLILARSLVGFGAGNVAVVRSYVAGATTLKERTSSMANMSACQAIGFIIGPVVQIAMVPIGYPGLVHIESLHLDLYTSPAILSAIVGVINIILLFAVFKEHRVDNDEDINFSIQESPKEQSIVPDYKPDYFAVISSILLFFVILFIFAVFETITTPLTMHMYAWTKSNATLYNGIILGSGGVIAIVVFIGIKILSKRINERYILLGGFILCLGGFFVYLPWGSNYPAYQIAVINTIPAKTTEFSTSFNPSNQTTPSWIDSTTSGYSTSSLADSTTANIITHSEQPSTESYLSTHSTPENITSLTTAITQEQTTVLTTSKVLPTISTESSTSDRNEPITTSVRNEPINEVLNDHVIKNRHRGKNKLYFESNEIFDEPSVIHTTELPMTTDSVSNNSHTVEAVGCPEVYKWCAYTPIVSFPQFLLGTFLIVIGYPTCNVMSYTLYSKILGPKPQGIMMGWLTASGSLARTIGPIFVSQVYNDYGPRVTFIAMIIIVFLTTVLYLLVFKRLVPFKFTKDIESPT